MGILEDLYNGYVVPADDMKPSKEYLRLNEEERALEGQLREALKGDETLSNLFDEIVDLQNTAEMEYGKDLFVYGFSMAVKLLLQGREI